jgi:hypothetical protein
VAPLLRRTERRRPPGLLRAVCGGHAYCSLPPQGLLPYISSGLSTITTQIAGPP